MFTLSSRCEVAYLSDVKYAKQIPFHLNQSIMPFIAVTLKYGFPSPRHESAYGEKSHTATQH